MDTFIKLSPQSNLMTRMFIYCSWDLNKSFNLGSTSRLKYWFSGKENNKNSKPN